MTLTANADEKGAGYYWTKRSEATAVTQTFNTSEGSRDQASLLKYREPGTGGSCTHRHT